MPSCSAVGFAADQFASNNDMLLAHFKNTSPTASHNSLQLMRCRLWTKVAVADLHHAVKCNAVWRTGEIYSTESTGNIPCRTSVWKPQDPAASMSITAVTQQWHRRWVWEHTVCSRVFYRQCLNINSYCIATGKIVVPGSWRHCVCLCVMITLTVWGLWKHASRRTKDNMASSSENTPWLGM